MLSVGTIAGFFIGGKMVDHLGAKPVFLGSHIVFALSLAGVLLRDSFPFPPLFVLGAFSLCLGATQGAAGIAGTSELLALIPPENKSLSTGFNIVLSSAGLSLAGLFNGYLLKMNVLPQGWRFFGHSMSTYDTLLAGFAVLSVLMAATIGLVPTIRNLRSQWLPQNR
jgi:MFS family permease